MKKQERRKNNPTLKVKKNARRTKRKNVLRAQVQSHTAYLSRDLLITKHALRNASFEIARLLKAVETLTPKKAATVTVPATEAT